MQKAYKSPVQENVGIATLAAPFEHRRIRSSTEAPSTIDRPWSIQEDVASQSYRIQIGAKVKPALGKFEEHDLALRAGYRASRFDALCRSRSAAA